MKIKQKAQDYLDLGISPAKFREQRKRGSGQILQKVQLMMEWILEKEVEQCTTSKKIENRLWEKSKLRNGHSIRISPKMIGSVVDMIIDTMTMNNMFKKLDRGK